MQIDCYGFEASSQWFKRRTLDPYLIKRVSADRRSLCGAKSLEPCGILSASSWKKIIRRATSSIASERYQSVDAFAADIRRRHWLRNAVAACLVGLSLTIAGFAVGNLPRMLMDPFTAEFRHEGNVDGREVYSLELGGRWLHAGEDQRVTLSGPALYKVKGPGGLYANVDGVGDVEIEVGLAAFHNETEIPLKDSSIKYRMTGNTSLIFNRLHNEDAPDKLIYGPAFNQVSFGFGKRE